MLKVLGLFVRYGLGSHGGPASAVSTIDDLLRLYRYRFHHDVSTIVIDNALPPETAPVDHGTHWVIAGDNRCSEFSAWDRGFAFARTLGLEPDVVHLVTSTFNSLYSAYTRFVDETLLQLVVNRDVCVGHLDAYNEAVTLFGVTSQHWARTSYLLLSRNLVAKLGSFVSVHDPSILFPDDPSALFAEKAPLSENYKEYIVRWISGDDIGQVIRWHSGFAITPAELPRFRRKAHAIVNEHMLSVRIRQAGARVLDAIWLGDHFQKMRVPLLLEGWCPDWRYQIASRPEGALVLGGSGFVPVRPDDAPSDS